VEISNIFSRAGIYIGDVKMASAQGCKIEINFKDLSLSM